MELTAVLMLVIGLVLGAAGAWFALRSRAASAADARSETANARSESATLRAEVARLEALAAEVASQLAAALAERDSARDRAQKLAEDRQSLVNEFKVLSGETL